MNVTYARTVWHAVTHVPLADIAFQCYGDDAPELHTCEMIDCVCLLSVASSIIKGFDYLFYEPEREHAWITSTWHIYVF